jgi:hypothetical protein
LDAAFHVADSLEILAEFVAVALRQIAPQTAQFFADHVQNAAIFADACEARVPIRAVALVPKSRSKTARGSFSIGSGVVGLLQHSVLAYAQL